MEGFLLFASPHDAKQRFESGEILAHEYVDYLEKVARDQLPRQTPLSGHSISGEVRRTGISVAIIAAHLTVAAVVGSYWFFTIGPISYSSAEDMHGYIALFSGLLLYLTAITLWVWRDIKRCAARIEARGL